MKKNTRKEFSLRQLAALKTQISKIKELKNEKSVCIYTTGSYGRLEAGKSSDIDLFFLTNGKGISKISKTLIDANIIKICREMYFPEFSGDGEYLEFHVVDNILEELGSRKDDYLNYFTARMLLLLESKPINNDELYHKIIGETLERYYRDFKDHTANFHSAGIFC